MDTFYTSQQYIVVQGVATLATCTYNKQLLMKLVTLFRVLKHHSLQQCHSSRTQSAPPEPAIADINAVDGKRVI